MSSPAISPSASDSRTFDWRDPLAAAAAARALSGLSFLQAILRDEQLTPPILRALDIVLTCASDGEVSFSCVPKSYHYNCIGSVHGGLAATLIDSATGLAVHSTLDVGVAWTTVNLRVDYIRPMFSDTGAVTCVGRVTHRGRRISLAEAEIRDPSDKVIARGTATCMVLR